MGFPRLNIYEIMRPFPLFAVTFAICIFALLLLFNTMPRTSEPFIIYVFFHGNGGSTLYLADGYGNEYEIPTQIQDPLAPVWSPDGGWIAFNAARNGQNKLFIQGVFGHRVGQLSVHGDNTTPRWSPDGQWIYSTTDYLGRRVVYRVRRNDSDYELALNAADVEMGASPSPDGSFIVFASNSTALSNRTAELNGQNPDPNLVGDWDIYRYETASGNVRRLTSTTGADIAPHVSPDSEQIVFQSFRDGNWELYTITSEGGNLQRLTNTIDRSEIWPKWSPDGRWILYQGQDALNESHIYKMRPNGSDFQRLTHDTPLRDRNLQPDWSPLYDIELATAPLGMLAAALLLASFWRMRKN